MTLRVLNPDASDLRAIIRERVVSATTDSATWWRVAIHAFCGLQDNIVPEASARGVFDNIKEVTGTHFSIIQPSDRRDARYAEFVELLLEPGGHAHRFDVETYECVVRVEPRQPQSISTASEKNPRTVTFDNYATQTRTVRSSPANKCKDKFKLIYRTRKEGICRPDPSHHNEASPADIGLWEDTGTFYEFDFTPEAGNEYRLKVEIYGGFDEGNRNIHYHLGNDSRYRRLIYVLDLSAYIVDHYVIKEGPHFYLNPTDIGHSELCDQRTLRDPVEPVSQTPDGIFRWEVERVEQGVVDIVWDVARIDVPSVAAGSVASAQIDDGKTDPFISLKMYTAVVGYGSLLSIESLSRGLKRDYDGPFVACHVAGWRRSWDAWMPNAAFYYIEGGERIYPEKIIYLKCTAGSRNPDELHPVRGA